MNLAVKELIQGSGIIADVQTGRGAEHKLEVVKGMQAVLLGGFDDGIEHGGGVRAVDGVRKQPVFSVMFART